MNKVEEVIFLNRVNTNTVGHTTAGINTVWTGISYMTLDLVALNDANSNIQLATNVAGQENIVDYSVAGELVFSLGDQDISPGTYNVELTATDGNLDKTQIFHPDRDYVQFLISSTKTVV